MKLKISAFCWECLKDAGNTKEDYEQLLAEHPEMAGDYLVELNEENLYRIECHKGHVTYTVQHQQKFELLFDFAAMALLDGYTREAVAGMAAALERFYEFYLSVVCLDKGITLEDFESTWKHLAKQSERQLGAYLMLSLIEGNNILPDLGRRVEFRNNVIHKAYIPTSAEAMDFGEYVLSMIFPVLKTLNDGKHFNLTIHQHLTKNREKMRGAARIMSSSGPSIINVSEIGSEGFGDITFVEALKRMSEGSYSRIRFVRSI